MAVFVELLAQLSLVATGHVLLLLQLLFTVGEGTLVAVGALFFTQPTLAQFCLDLDFVVLRHYPAGVLEGEWIRCFIFLQVRPDADLALYVLAYTADFIVEPSLTFICRFFLS